MNLKVKEVFSRGTINYKDKNGNPKVLHKATALVSGDVAFQHEFVSADREIQIGDDVSFPEWRLMDNIRVKDGRVYLSINCDPSGIVKNEKSA